jgi:hypothetical protein
MLSRLVHLDMLFIFPAHNVYLPRFLAIHFPVLHCNLATQFHLPAKNISIQTNVAHLTSMSAVIENHNHIQGNVNVEWTSP